MWTIGITALGLLVGSACAHADHSPVHTAIPPQDERIATAGGEDGASRQCRIERKWDTSGSYRDQRKCEGRSAARGPEYGDPRAERGVVLYPAR